MDYQLRKLEKRSLETIREAKDKFTNLAVLESGSNESKVCISLCKRAFFGKIPFPALKLNKIEEIKEEIKKQDIDALMVATKALKSVLKEENCSIICPLADWPELDIWMYIKENNISTDENVEEMVKKLQTGQGTENRGKEEEKEEIMQRLRDLGYR